MSHILKAAAELFEAIEKDARALVFPMSEWIRTTSRGHSCLLAPR